MNDEDMRIGRGSLVAAINGDYAECHRLLQQLTPEHDLWAIALAWADTLIARYPAGTVADKIGIGFFDSDRNTIETANDVPPPARWAGRFVFARARFDRELAQDLWLSQTDGQFGWNMQQLVMMCALTIRQIDSRKTR